jgi:hypothetical protein
MSLLPFKEGIQVVYIVRLKGNSRYLAKVRDYLAWLDSYKYIRFLSLRYYIILELPILCKDLAWFISAYASF